MIEKTDLLLVGRTDGRGWTGHFEVMTGACYYRLEPNRWAVVRTLPERITAQWISRLIADIKK
jgi:hypothetical protein